MICCEVSRAILSGSISRDPGVVASDMSCRIRKRLSAPS
jgi:hypothetical protein